MSLLEVSITDYPRTLDPNIRFRAELLKACEVDPILQTQIKELCHRDILFWVNVFCWTKDPRRKTDIIPFVCYDPYQSKYILDIQKAIDEQYDQLTDKTRDMGVSWMILYVFMHKWLFEEGSDFRVGSRKEEFVDRMGDIDTLFEKIRFNLKRQPLWLMPAGFNWQNPFPFMKIINPENGNAIIGESANESFGSGGRRKAILLDEFAKWEPKIAEAAWTATADVSQCRLPVSTPFGSANKFAQLAQGTKEIIKRISLHWTLHPLKGKDPYYLDAGIKIPLGDAQSAFKAWKSGIKVRSPWYDKECKRRKDAEVAQELDIDYLRAGRPFFDLRALSTQLEWAEFTRKLPSDPIPYGKYFRAKLIERRAGGKLKIEIRDMASGWLKIFELPKPGWQYVLSGDVGEGLAKGDECFGIVREKVTRNVVATFNGLFKPEEFADFCWLVEKLYNNALNAIENNNHGYTTNLILNQKGSNLYYTKKDEVKGGEQETPKRGWSTTTKTRPLMLDDLEEEIRRKVFEIRDSIIIAQCRTFVTNEKTGKPEADGDFLDDSVLSLAIGGRVITENPFKGSREPIKERQRILVQEKMRKRHNAGIKYGRRTA